MDNRVADVRFQGAGCAISIASASLMTDAVKGKSETELRAMFERFQVGMTAKDDADDAFVAPTGSKIVYTNWPVGTSSPKIKR
jgi:nitrogen fixation NifU-like protein